MPQISSVAEAFLDGFGSLGAIVEPPVRPGSTENLIEDVHERDVTGAEVSEGRTNARIGYLVWLFLGSICLLAGTFALSVASTPQHNGWAVELTRTLTYVCATLFAREFAEDVLMVQWKRWRQHMAEERKAAHRA